jgi:hypothetical protein
MKNFYWLIILLVLLIACVPAVTPLPAQSSSLTPLPPTAIYTFTPSPTHTETPERTPSLSLPLYQSVALTSWTFRDDSIIARVPTLTGSLDPRALKFNHEMTALVDNAIRLYFDINSKDLPADPNLPESFLAVRFELLSPPGNIISLKFDITSYAKGAAHPFDYSQTATYDLEKGEDLTLEQLFLPSSDYLGIISAFCIDKLQASEFGPVFSEDGAQPDKKNYRNWNITVDGLLITFDEYQVAPYAAGPQQVLIPYSEMQSIIDPQGPLAAYLP